MQSIFLFTFIYLEHFGTFRNNLTLSSNQSYSEDFRQFSICLLKVCGFYFIYITKMYIKKIEEAGGGMLRIHCVSLPG